MIKRTTQKNEINLMANFECHACMHVALHGICAIALINLLITNTIYCTSLFLLNEISSLIPAQIIREKKLSVPRTLF